MKTQEKVEITSAILNDIRSKYPATKGMDDNSLIECLLKWENQFLEDGLTRNLISFLVFPTFNEFALFQKSKA